MLFGRDFELARIDEALRLAREGKSLVLLVRGPAGIGKSALLDHARDGAAGMTVLGARGVEAESELPFAGLTELLGPVVELASGLPGALASAMRGALTLESAGSPDRFAVGVGTLGLLAAATDQAPLLVLVEDLHWLDAASVDALAFAARRLRAEPIALVASCRDETRTTFDSGGFEELVLHGLDVAAGGRLLAERAGQPVARGVVERLVAATGGNPLALGELAGVLQPSQLAGGVALPDPLPARASAERLFADRIAALDPEARRALLLAAAAGEGDAQPVLAAGSAGGLSPGVFERAEASGLLVFADGGLGFCHPLVRSAAYAAAAPGERRAAHQALSNSLPDDRRAWHLAAAAVGADELAAAALERAAERASRRGGFAAAAAALERAGRLSPGVSDRTRRLLAAADACRVAGRTEPALELLDEIDELADDPDIHAASLAARARVELTAGRARDAWRHYAGAAKLLERTDRQQAASALARAALAALVAGDHNDAVAMAAMARGWLDDHSEAIAGPISALILGYSLWRSGSTAEGVSLLIPAAEFAERPHPDEPEYGPFAAFILVLIGEHRRAESILERWIDEARSAGALGVLPWALYVSAYLDIRRGRWTSAYASASEAVDIAVETGGALWRCLALSSLVMVGAGQGRERDCRSHADDALALAEHLGIKPFMHDIYAGLGLLELVRGDIHRAIEALERSISVPGGQPSLQLRPSTPDLVEAYVRVNHPGAGRLAQLAGEQTETIDIPELSALAARCRGLVAADDELDRHFGDALRLFQAAELPFQLARTALNYGERLRRTGRRREARAQLHAALEIFDRLGATPWAERAESELRATGERIRRRDLTAADELTAQELQIALVVARGATNREAAAALFLSHKTVERHLSVIYRKLGLRSRSELTRALANESITDTGAE